MRIAEEKTCEVLVVGGGVAGVAAALQAARKGKRVILVEKCVQLGGLATTGLVNLFVPMCNGRGVQIIKGMADEFLRWSIQYGYDDLPEEWKNGEPGFGNTTKRLVCHFSAPIFALVLCRELINVGVELMFDTMLTDVDCKDGHVESVTVFNKSGYSQIRAKMYVDTTGDSDLLHYAGVPTVTRGNFHTYGGLSLSLETCQKAIDANTVAKLYFDLNGGRATLKGKNHPEGMPLWDGTDGEQVTKYITTNQLELLDNIKDQDRHSRDIVMLPAMAQFRTTRRIDGDYTLTTDDAYQHRNDSIGAICDFDHRDVLYEVPYGTLVRQGYDNVITAGRTASAHGEAWEVLRVIPPAIITGQAAGMAVAQAIDKGCAIGQVSVAQLQKDLEQENVMIHFDDALVPENIKTREVVDIGHI